MSTTYRKMTPGGETPTGSVTITENGTYDVTDKASAIVQVSGIMIPESFANIDF